MTEPATTTYPRTVRFEGMPPEELKTCLERAQTLRDGLEARLPPGTVHRLYPAFQVLALPPCGLDPPLIALLEASCFEPLDNTPATRASLELGASVTDAWCLWVFPARGAA